MTLIILKNLLNDDKYFDTVFPYLKEEYFDIRYENIIFKSIVKYQKKYGFHPSESELELLIENSKMEEDDKSKLLKYYDTVKNQKTFDNFDFIIDETEEFVQNSDMRNSLIKAIEIVSDKPEKRQEIRDVIDSSLSIHFDNSVGLDLSESALERYKYYSEVLDSGFKCDIDILNKITNNGFKRKTLAFIAGEVHSGKTLFGTHMATSFALNGHNVLFITLEISEFEIGKRIDSNMFNIKMSDFYKLKEEDFLNNMKDIYSNGSVGEIVIKEYPTASASVSHIKGLLKELKDKKKFIPDVIFIDYLGIMESSSDSMYESMKRNAEGLRAIAVEEDLFIMTFGQVNRGGFGKAMPTMADLAESTGPAQISDFLAIIGKVDIGDEVANNEDPDSIFKRNQHIYLNVVKNRYGGSVQNSSPILVQDFWYMRLEEFKTDAQIDSERKSTTPDMSFLNNLSNEPTQNTGDVFKF